MKAKTIKRFFIVLIAIAGLGIAFIYGVGVGAKKWFPYTLISDFRKGTLFQESVAYKDNDGELLQFAFDQPILKSELLYDPICSLEELYQANKADHIDVKDFFDAYDQIQLTGHPDLIELDNGNSRVLELPFLLSGKYYKAYAYKIDAQHSTNNRAALIIPGSGNNHSSAIYANDPDDYHYGIVDVLTENDINIYIYIKPNQDVLAYHNGQFKINNNFFVNWHLNQGSSYSASYIARSLAFTKYLKQQYDQTAVVGLSQGGKAAFLNAMQAEPNAAIIASGFSAINKNIEWANHGQIIIPGMSEIYTPTYAFEAIQDKCTQWFFSYGEQEIGTYRIEATSQITCTRFEPLGNVECVVHDAGHVFPVNDIDRFLKERFRNNHEMH